MTDQNRDELLIRIDERTDTLMKQFSNHIKHHWAVTIPIIIIALGLVIVLLTK